MYRPVNASDSPPRPSSSSSSRVPLLQPEEREVVIEEEESKVFWSTSGGASDTRRPSREEGLRASLLDSGDTYPLSCPLDVFLTRVYDYHQAHGFVCLVLSELTEILTFLVIFFLILFLSLFIDYDTLLDADDDTVSFWDDVVDVPDGFHPAYAFFMLFGLYAIFKIALFVRNIPRWWEMKIFFSNYLHISEGQLQHISWGRVAELLVCVPGLCLSDDDWTELDVVNRIMRHENYFIALVNREIFDMNLAIFKWLPGSSQYYFATDSLGLLVSFVIHGLWEDRKRGKLIPSIFEAKDNHNVLAELDSGFQRRFRMVGALALLCLPITFVYMTAFLLLQYGNEYRDNPSNVSIRTWSVFARWKFREINELPHVFHSRIAKGVAPATHYLSHFRSYPIGVIGQFFSFVLGSLILALLFLGLWSDNLLSRVEFAPGKSGVWVIGILTIGFAFFRSFIVPPMTDFNPEKALNEVVTHTHYMPPHWVNAAHLKKTSAELKSLLPNRFTVILTELVGLVLAPFILIFRMPESSRRIILFFSKYSVSDPHMGDMCSFASFPLTTHGDPSFTPSVDESNNPSQRLQGAKLERSLISFAEQHPSWKMSQEGEGLVRELAGHAKEMNSMEMEGNVSQSGSFSSIIPPPEGQNNYHYDIDAVQQSFFRPPKEEF
uniref:Autophagy-related protein 9 n=1 Tax=Paramoeba aestuarina TaxID=180227 RepID=A0A7S4JTY8_9EUKA|mmetsp:Transcript_12997/g.20008  ORF Transcript_12997/g.20008 Transcript_12997/m.20008 type:complete len:663 (+) Transcript_12997:66-2054(+)|eukprot:CAMPEP_0201525038 /NCGR_PEP_ID=MMETSP0161_2-20130828/26455_1 /ASSEMBLY_ACC=CAM_ASM_000251 /TAXON_ID=180227 /ORGANISM="Neoparamoeba aestuarina, Strain SoJaBio B1-5/56/2" /LENGTH=662 /DNA_ID=CAMNT_0047924757 /DNA_START=69 /DNA_END=2057 /DNA_ORIENTATION=+